MTTDALARTASQRIEKIQRRADGSYILLFNSYPFHATELDTPDVYDLVKTMIDEGAPWTHYVEPALPGENLEQIERAWRDAEIERVKWLRERHRDELDMEGPTTLTAEQFAEVLVYLQALRDWPQSEHFPDATQRPQPVTWLADLL